MPARHDPDEEDFQKCKMHIMSSLERIEANQQRMWQQLDAMKEDFTGFKGKLMGVAAAVSFVITVIVQVASSLFGKHGP